jgi:hypothetical protein
MTDITQENLYLLLPSKVSRVSDMLAEDAGIGILDAIRRVYRSDMYRHLETESTKLWHEGPVSLYSELTLRQ